LLAFRVRRYRRFTNALWSGSKSRTANTRRWSHSDGWSNSTTRVMPGIGAMKALNARQPKPLVCCSVDKFFVQPMTTVVTPPNLPPHQPTRNCASRYNDPPEMPIRCPRRALVQSEHPGVDRNEADGCHCDPLGSIDSRHRISIRGRRGHSAQQSADFPPDLRSLRYFCRSCGVKRRAELLFDPDVQRRWQTNEARCA
jgi:hypothetical protein